MGGGETERLARFEAKGRVNLEIEIEIEKNMNGEKYIKLKLTRTESDVSMSAKFISTWAVFRVAEEISAEPACLGCPSYYLDKSVVNLGIFVNAA